MNEDHTTQNNTQMHNRIMNKLPKMENDARQSVRRLVDVTMQWMRRLDSHLDKQEQVQWDRLVWYRMCNHFLFYTRLGNIVTKTAQRKAG
jgi:hypothetical protein